MDGDGRTRSSRPPFHPHFISTFNIWQYCAQKPLSVKGGIMVLGKRESGSSDRWRCLPEKDHANAHIDWLSVFLYFSVCIFVFLYFWYRLVYTSATQRAPCGMMTNRHWRWQRGWFWDRLTFWHIIGQWATQQPADSAWERNATKPEMKMSKIEMQSLVKYIVYIFPLVLCVWGLSGDVKGWNCWNYKVAILLCALFLKLLHDYPMEIVQCFVF